MEISVVVPTYNRRETVQRTLQALFAQMLAPHRYEVIVVVDGSTDGTFEALKQLRPACGFQVVKQENRGLAGARNTGFRSANTDLLLFLDDDMLCDPGLVETHINAHHEADSSVAFGAIFLSPDSAPSLAAECFNREIGSTHIQRKTNPNLPWTIKECTFSNASIARTWLDKLGGFDESFRMREDLEFGIRLFQGDHPVRPFPLPAAVVYQYYDKTAKDLVREARAFAVADLLLSQKHPAAKIKGHVNTLSQERGWKPFLRRIAARMPAVADLLLGPLCVAGQFFYPIRPIRNLGIRALQARRRIHWLHHVMKLRSNADRSAHAKSA